MDSSRDIVKKLRENRILQERASYESMEDNELIKLAQSGDNLATETLIRRHEGFIKKMSAKYFFSGGDKDDVIQTATWSFWDAIKSYNPKTSGDFLAYAGMIIKRGMKTEIEKDQTKKAQVLTQADSMDSTVRGDSEEGEGASLGDTLPSSELTPEEEYLGIAGARDIMKFLKEALSSTEREVLDKYIKGYKVSEIAEEMNMKYKSVENAIMRVKNKLADYLRARESKKITEDKGLEFSDIEKQVLSSLLNKIRESEEPEDKE